MTGHDYEYAAAAWLRWHGYRAVRVTRASGDFGVDVICTRHSRRYAVQCKYYTHPVGLPAVQEAVAGKAQYGCEEAMVVTNTVLTRAARELAESNGVTVLENVQPRHVLSHPMAVFLKVLLTLCWLAAIGWSGWEAYNQAGLPKLPVQEPWVLPLALLPVPLAIWLVLTSLRFMLWRVTRHKQERLTRLEQEDKEDLQRCVTVATALAMQTYPAEAFHSSGQGASNKTVMDLFPGSRLMRTVLKAVGSRRSFTLSHLSSMTGLSPEAARTLADCLVKAGMLVCTKPPRYAWSRLSLDHEHK